MDELNRNCQSISKQCNLNQTTVQKSVYVALVLTCFSMYSNKKGYFKSFTTTKKKFLCGFVNKKFSLRPRLRFYSLGHLSRLVIKSNTTCLFLHSLKRII